MNLIVFAFVCTWIAIFAIAILFYMVVRLGVQRSRIVDLEFASASSETETIKKRTSDIEGLLTRLDGRVTGNLAEHHTELEAHRKVLVEVCDRGVLSAQTIKEMMIVEPCRDAFTFNGLSGGLSACGYDISLLEEVNVPSGCFKLGASMEQFNMPQNVVGIVHDKSTWARQGLALQNTVLEPGWRGYLTLEISNHGKHSIRIPAMTPIAQVVFHFLDEPTKLPYEGKYQDQPKEAVTAKFA